jgi:LacI family transcriptional regulator
MTKAARSNRRIALLVPTGHEAMRQIIRGVARYALERGLTLLHVPVMDREQLAALKQRGLAGVVGVMDDERTRDVVQTLGVPAINVSGRTRVPGVPTVGPDHDEIGRLAAAHLLGRGFRHLAYLGPARHVDSATQGQSFSRAVRAARAKLLEMPADDASSAAQLKALRDAPRPLAFFCADDALARATIGAAESMRLRVPQDVAVLGTDNDPVACQAGNPTLSSIDPNWQRVGFDAMARLERLIAGRAVTDRTFVVPRGIVPRESTNITASEDLRVTSALEFIHARAGESISVVDVARRVGANRRTIERHFRGALRKSVAGAIRTAHVEFAKQLLIDTDLPLEEVAEQCGMNDLRQLRILFTKEAGKSPSDFRRTFWKQK